MKINIGVHGGRGLFSFFVLVYHVANSGLPVWDMPALVHGFLHSLKFGVELFFAISGYVIAGTMLRSRTPLGFLSNRATRIFPVLWVTVLVVIAMSLASGRELPATLSLTDLLWLTVANMMALPGVLPIPLFHPAAWTLSYEFAFYLICFVYLVVQRRWNVRPLLPALFIGAVLAFIFPRGLFFFSGIIVAAGLLDRPSVRALTREPLIWLAVFLFAWMNVSNPTQPFFTTMADWFGTWKLPMGIVAFIACTLALQGIAWSQGLLYALLRTAPMQWLGTISYSLYLWHPIVLAVVKAGMIATGIVAMVGPASQLVFFLIALVPSLVVSHYSQIVLENWLTNRLRRRKVSRPETVAA